MSTDPMKEAYNMRGKSNSSIPFLDKERFIVI